MGSRQLARLENLSEKRADHSRDIVDRSRADLVQLDRQHDELSAISLEYQRTSVGESHITPTLLSHRRAFVSQLTKRIYGLDSQRKRHSELLATQEQEYKERAAQTAAIGAMRESRQHDESIVAARMEQQAQDEASRVVSTIVVSADEVNEHD